MKLWYQSFTDWEVHGAYLTRLERYLGEIAAEETAIEVAGMRPPDLAVHRISELRCACQAIDNAVAAEAEGFDAVLLGHFQDSGLAEARCALDIPVVGLGEASMLYAMQLGRRFGLVTIDPLFVDWHEEQAQRLGLASRLVGVTAMSTPPGELVAAFEDEGAYAGLLAKFREGARALVERGAEVLIPAGGLFALLSAGERRFRVGEAVVLNPIAVALRAAETAVWLRRQDGTEASRAGAFAKPPPAAVEELRALVRGEGPQP
ncbi:MAG: hypothetical protein JSU06_16040 [Actinobacteria bacterium]|nr:hypothetical protein [Actinomycetota bacterium]